MLGRAGHLLSAASAIGERLATLQYGEIRTTHLSAYFGLPAETGPANARTVAATTPTATKRTRYRISAPLTRKVQAP